MTYAAVSYAGVEYEPAASTSTFLAPIPLPGTVTTATVEARSLALVGLMVGGRVALFCAVTTATVDVFPGTTGPTGAGLPLATIIVLTTGDATYGVVIDMAVTVDEAA